MFCKHKWTIISKTYSPPVDKSSRDSIAEEAKLTPDGVLENSILEKMSLGVTTVLLKCEKCSKLKSIEMLGKEIPK